MRIKELSDLVTNGRSLTIVRHPDNILRLIIRETRKGTLSNGIPQEEIFVDQMTIDLNADLDLDKDLFVILDKLSSRLSSGKWTIKI